MPKRASKDPRLLLTFPIGGIVDTVPRTQQPPTQTASCMNVLPFDLTRRGRGGVRPGTVKVWATQYGTSGDRVFRFMGVCPSTAGVFVVLVCGGNVYQGTIASAPTQVTGGGSAFTAARRVEGSVSRGFLYLTDGLVYKKLELATATLTDWTATGRLDNMRQVQTWFDCIVLAEKSGAEWLWQMARATDPTDFDTGGTVTPDMPVTANINFNAGQIGEGIHALIVGMGNELIFGLDSALYRLVGHPADGGVMRVISEKTGILTPDSWEKVDQSVYFVGPNGFFLFDQAEVLSLSESRYDTPFASLPSTGWHVNVVSDWERHGLWVFMVNASATGTQRSFWWDLRLKAFFPVSFAGTDHGPSRACWYDDGQDTYNSRVLLACCDGYVRQFSQTAGGDDGTAIASSIFLGPYIPAGDNFEQFGINGLWATLGDLPSGFSSGDWNLNYSAQFGPDPKTALDNPVRTVSGSWTAPGRQAPIGLRQAFGAMYLKLYNSTLGKVWGFEEATMPLEFQGRLRS